MKIKSLQTYISAIRWYLVNILDMKKMKVCMGKIDEDFLPLVTLEEFNKLLSWTKCCYKRKNKGKQTC